MSQPGSAFGKQVSWYKVDPFIVFDGSYLPQLTELPWSVVSVGPNGGLHDAALV